MKISKILERAKRSKNIEGGFVLCDVCGNPASKEYSTAMSWVGCGPCMTGESETLDPADFIHVGGKQ